MSASRSNPTLVGFQPLTAPPRIGVLASGRGSNLQALVAAYSRGDLPAPVAVDVQRIRELEIRVRNLEQRLDAEVEERRVGGNPPRRLRSRP